VKWLPLFEIANAYSYVYVWFEKLRERQIRVISYVIMPNHIHIQLWFPGPSKSINAIIGNGKRFLAYAIIKLLENKNENKLLEELYGYVKGSDRKKGQRYKVFEKSFDARECYNREMLFQKFNYIHHNPVSKRWNLAANYCEYKYSSASFYEGGCQVLYDKIMHISEL